MPESLNHGIYKTGHCCDQNLNWILINRAGKNCNTAFGNYSGCNVGMRILINRAGKNCNTAFGNYSGCNVGMRRCCISWQGLWRLIPSGIPSSSWIEGLKSISVAKSFTFGFSAHIFATPNAMWIAMFSAYSRRNSQCSSCHLCHCTPRHAQLSLRPGVRAHERRLLHER